MATELTFGTLRQLGRVDHVLSAFLRRPLSALTPWIRSALRLGAYQLLFLDRIPASAAVNEAVSLARRYGHEGTAGLVNGVLRNLVRQGPPPLPSADAADVTLAERLAVTYSHPRWLVERWLGELGQAETEALLRADNEAPALTVRVNHLRTTAAALQRSLEADGVTVRPLRHLSDGFEISGFDILSGLRAYRAGEFVVQDEAAMLVADIVAPQQGERVIDACAAPGGKTAAMADKMANIGEILAADVEPDRLRRVEENCRRLGITCVKTVASDARSLGDLHPGWADRVLVDAPCSGLGTLRRRPDARWRKEAAGSAQLARLQAEILAGVLPCVRPGGILVYSTCTIGRTENQSVVEALLAAHPELAPDEIKPHVPTSLSDAVGDGGWWLQTYPHRHGIDGFFIARLRRLR